MREQPRRRDLERPEAPGDEPHPEIEPVGEKPESGGAGEQHPSMDIIGNILDIETPEVRRDVEQERNVARIVNDIKRKREMN